MANENETGYSVMYTGKPSKPGKTQQQIGYGLVEGDGLGYTDVADSVGGDQIKKGLVKGKRLVKEESSKTTQGFRYTK